MSAKDVIVEVLKANRDTYTINDEELLVFMRVTNPIILEEEFPKVAQQILDSLPRLSRDEVEKMVYYIADAPRQSTLELAGWPIKKAEDYIKARRETANRIIDQICSLVPEHKWVQTTDDKGNVIVPLGEVVAEGKVKDDAFEYAGGYKIGGNDIDSFFYEHHNQSGTLVWVPDKEVKDER